MNDQSPSPAPFPDDELREILDLLATTVASMSNRIDGLATVANKQIQVSTEARIAAFAAQEQTDPKKYGEIVGSTIDGKINDNLIRMGQMCIDLFSASNGVQDVLKKAEQDKWEILNGIRQREKQVDRWKTRLPWFVLGAAVITLALTVTLPRFSAANSTTCVVFGGEWLRTTNGNPACVHYQN